MEVEETLNALSASKANPHVNETQFLNYKHQGSSKCSLTCLKKFLKDNSKKYYSPYPIYFNENDSHENDYFMKLLKRKRIFYSNISKVESNFKKLKKKEKTNNELRYYKKLQRIISKDPDKYFNSIYNWYYTGGNLSLQNIGDLNLIFFVTNSSKLNVAEIEKDITWKLNYKSAVNHSSSIFQLDTVHVNGEIFIVARRKHDIMFYNVKTSNRENIDLDLMHLHDSESPYVSMSFNKQECEDYAYVNANQVIEIWNTIRSKVLLNYQVDFNINALEEDCFAQIYYLDKHTLWYLNRNDFIIFDKRSKRIAKDFQLNNKNFLQSNDRFVNMHSCKNDSRFCYFTTFHEVILFDIRNHKIVNKYGHSFKDVPFLSSSCENSNGGSTHCFSSNNPDEKLIIEEEKNLFFLPSSLPSLKQSYEKNLIINPIENLCLQTKQRLDNSVTGLQFYPISNNSTTLFVSNTLGDIFCYEMTDDFNEEFEKSVSYEWNATKLNKKLFKDLIFSDKIILNKLGICPLKEPVDLSDINLLAYSKNVKELQKKKQSSNNFSNIWKDDGEISLDDIEQIDSRSNVENWLDNYCNNEEQ